jgi:hypothetical protein
VCHFILYVPQNRSLIFDVPYDKTWPACMSIVIDFYWQTVLPQLRKEKIGDLI